MFRALPEIPFSREPLASADPALAKGSRLNFLVGFLLLLSGCQQKMADQPSFKPLTPSSLFSDGRSARPLIPGTVARGHLRTDLQRFTGLNQPPEEEGFNLVQLALDNQNILKALLEPGDVVSFVDTFPYPVTAAMMERGKQRYTIFCAVCHDSLGSGRGKIVERGYTPPPSLHVERLRRAPVGHFFDVITNGYGSMPSYAAQIPPDDRWAIVAYIRALQLSQHARPADLPAEDQKELAGGGQQP